MRAVILIVAFLFSILPACAEITSEALQRFEASVREIAPAMAKPPAEWPTLENKAFATALRTMTDANALFGTQPLSADDGRATSRITSVMRQLTARQASGLAAIEASGNRTALAAQAEIAAILTAFNMKCGAANADVLSDLYVKNPTNQAPDLLDATRGFLLDYVTGTISSGIEFVTNRNLTGAQRRDVVTALADSMERMARALPTKRRWEISDMLTHASSKLERELRPIFERAIASLNAAACNAVCAAK